MLDLLGLPGVRPVDLQSEGGGITITAETTESPTPDCPGCGKAMHRHGSRKTTFADTPQQMQPVRLQIIRPRHRCAECGKMMTPELEFLDEKRRVTTRLIEEIRKRCLNRTFHSLADETGLAVNTIKNITLDLISELEQTVRYQTPVIMGIDELKLAGDYRCIITNLATNSVFDMLEKRTKAHMKPFFRALPDREQVEWVCTDMWRPFKESFGPYLPNARLVIDKFHVVRMASDALEYERKKLQATLQRSDRLKVKKSLRWLTLKRSTSLTPDECKTLEIVRDDMPKLAEAYDFKEAFYDIYDASDKAEAIRVFESWQNSLPEGELPKFHALARTVRNHCEDIFAYWDAPVRITNAYTEGMNGIVKMANRLGRGYSYEIIRARAVYAEHARRVSISTKPGLPTTTPSMPLEYGPHIPTLADLAERGETG
ncbi:MAG: ISL3 family transposase [Algiphilus sp.]|uniref:ISL3 family transposase n=1 Tax=Algiphilus sp. TaxID=1872431 RepID=UPI0025B80EFC|nr:ISL3 family transposase [Algiphilus sp.]MCI5105000.1 ISL3 family transposase [Algiphilus sp.]